MICYWGRTKLSRIWFLNIFRFLLMKWRWFWFRFWGLFWSWSLVDKNLFLFKCFIQLYFWGIIQFISWDSNSFWRSDFSNTYLFILLIYNFINRIFLIWLRKRILWIKFAINYFIDLLKSFNLFNIKNKFLYVGNKRPWIFI
jgi:hypothetical protein